MPRTGSLSVSVSHSLPVVARWGKRLLPVTLVTKGHVKLFTILLLPQPVSREICTLGAECPAQMLILLELHRMFQRALSWASHWLAFAGPCCQDGVYSPGGGSGRERQSPGHSLGPPGPVCRSNWAFSQPTAQKHQLECCLNCPKLFLF